MKDLKDYRLATCKECKGSGIIEGLTDEGPYSVPFREDCVECDGEGVIEILIDDQDEDI
jgi:DnaJ-class molecular chaperone